MFNFEESPRMNLSKSEFSEISVSSNDMNDCLINSECFAGYLSMNASLKSSLYSSLSFSLHAAASKSVCISVLLVSTSSNCCSENARAIHKKFFAVIQHSIMWEYSC